MASKIRSDEQLKKIAPQFMTAAEYQHALNVGIVKPNVPANATTPRGTQTHLAAPKKK